MIQSKWNQMNIANADTSVDSETFPQTYMGNQELGSKEHQVLLRIQLDQVRKCTTFAIKNMICQHFHIASI